jgi:opacity protein-like surface antigen
MNAPLKKLLFLITAIFLSKSVLAQSDFEGFYTQIGIGYENDTLGSRSFTTSGATNGAPNGTVSGANSSGSAFSSAIGLGYNFSVAPKWLVGIGIDYSPTNVNTSTQLSYYGAIASNNYKVSNRFNIFLSPSYELDQNKLAYLKAGYSNETIGWQAQSGPPGAVNSSANQSGFIVGLGYKQLLNKNLYVFGEGNYYSYSSYTAGSINPTSGSFTPTQTPSAYQFLVGVGYKF